MENYLAPGKRDTINQASPPKCATGRQDALQLWKAINIGTWNIQGFLQAGKLHILVNLVVTRITKVCEHFETSNIVYISVAENHWLKSYDAVNDIILELTVQSKPNNCHILQLLYMPSTEATEDDIQEIYGNIENKIEKIPKK